MIYKVFHYEKVYKENNELREKVSALTENLSHYRTFEESLKRALVLAEETSKETIENALTLILSASACASETSSFAFLDASASNVWAFCVAFSIVSLDVSSARTKEGIWL